MVTYQTLDSFGHFFKTLTLSFLICKTDLNSTDIFVVRKISQRRKCDVGSILGLGRYPGVGNGRSLQYSCLENHMDRAAWQARVHRVTKSQTGLSDCAHTHTHTHTHTQSYTKKPPRNIHYHCY